MHIYAIIVAGGMGTRMGGVMPKQFQLLKGKPVLWHTITAFIRAYEDIQVVLVLPQDYITEGRKLAAEFSSQKIKISAGGETRFHSVKNGLQLVDAHALVFIHDGVRCLVTPSLIKKCADTALQKGNAVPAVAATDSIRIESGGTNKPVDRNEIRLIQTPQTFFSNTIKQAFEQPYEDSFTDEACVAEKAGIKINLVEGEETNIKITRPADLIIAEKILEQRENLK
jgi:2-C-methyl-D-erythritol 4-phosphate cytidylyltransferase